MVAELLRLNVRLSVNELRRSPWSAIRAAAEILLALALVAGFAWAILELFELEAAVVRRVAIIGGSLLSFAVFALPAFAARAELLDRRAFRGYGIRPSSLAAALFLLSFASPTLLFIVPLGFLPLLVWTEPVSGGLAAAAVALLVIQLVLSWRLGRALGTALAANRRARWAVRAAIVLVGLVGLAVLVLTLLPRLIPRLAPEYVDAILWIIRAAGARGLATVDEVLALSPWGALWAAAAPGRLGAPAMTTASIVVGAATVLLLSLLWFVVVRGSFRATWPTRAVRKRRVPGWFRLVGADPLGAMVARSFSYWMRDPRYRVAFVMLPVIPLVTILAFWIGGVPFSLGILLPLPLMVLLLAWATLHNDVAHDSTSMWALLTVQLEGRLDRLGRAIPVLVFGALLLAVGTPLTVWLHRDLQITPVVLGVGIALLLGGVGVSSAVSVRWPYPAPRPGDSAFQQPELAGTGVGPQAASLLLSIFVAAPAIAAAVAWLMGVPGPWNWVALGAGLLAGAGAFVAGVRLGGRDFDEAGPELLAFTMRN